MNSIQLLLSWNERLFQADSKREIDGYHSLARNAAILHIAIHDAVNGISRAERAPTAFASFVEQSEATRNASCKAAISQVAHDIMCFLYPSQKYILGSKLSNDLVLITKEKSQDYSGTDRILQGCAWGGKVARNVILSRMNDGTGARMYPYFGSTLPGKWRPTPPDFGPALTEHLGKITPFSTPKISEFLPASPPDITSLNYYRDFIEVAEVGRKISKTRSMEQTEIARFWEQAPLVTAWNNLAKDLANKHSFKLEEVTRLFALLNVAIADSEISAAYAKSTYDFWRPYHAITLGDTDANPRTFKDLRWLPLLQTPQHQEYPSGHSVICSAAANAFSTIFGDNIYFSVTYTSMDGFTVSKMFPSFTKVVAEVNNARIFGGIHFRSAVDAGTLMGAKLAKSLIESHMLPNRG